MPWWRPSKILETHITLYIFFHGYPSTGSIKKNLTYLPLIGVRYKTGAQRGAIVFSLIYIFAIILSAHAVVTKLSPTWGNFFSLHSHVSALQIFFYLFFNFIFFLLLTFPPKTHPVFFFQKSLYFFFVNKHIFFSK